MQGFTKDCQGFTNGEGDLWGLWSPLTTLVEQESLGLPFVQSDEDVISEAENMKRG